MMKDNLYAVIMAGGQGTRFWPRSRHRRPKQLLDIVGSESMIQQTVGRIKPLIPEERIFIVSNEIHVRELKDHIPHIPDSNIVIEPIGKNTAPAIGLTSLYIKRVNPEAILIVLPSDHLVEKEEIFRKTIKRAALVAQKNYLLTLGMKVTSPETGYGYIQMGSAIEDGLYRVKAFVEKPSKEKAERFMSAGGYLWNSGIFVWRADLILKMIEEYLPNLYRGLMDIDKVIGTTKEKKTIKSVYSELEGLSVDFGILEKARNVVVIPSDFGWNDVGSWTALDSILKKSPYGNIAEARHVSIDTTNTIVYSPRKLIATIGIKDLIIVETEDALLVCHKERAQDVKKLVDKLKLDGLEEYL
jgi:mannose-1-phosphate guanylyltransferase